MKKMHTNILQSKLITLSRIVMLSHAHSHGVKIERISSINQFFLHNIRNCVLYGGVAPELIRTCENVVRKYRISMMLSLKSFFKR